MPKPTQLRKFSLVKLQRKEMCVLHFWLFAFVFAFPTELTPHGIDPLKSLSLNINFPVCPWECLNSEPSKGGLLGSAPLPSVREMILGRSLSQCSAYQPFAPFFSDSRKVQAAPLCSCSGDRGPSSLLRRKVFPRAISCQAAKFP